MFSLRKPALFFNTIYFNDLENFVNALHLKKKVLIFIVQINVAGSDCNFIIILDCEEQFLLLAVPECRLQVTILFRTRQLTCC